ncbi:TetR family transcriptional regulator [Variovorax sp. J22P168]|uniref:TetR/AcrR family transcriptional regulator n=1 Tax=Variovorax jilinensis TaxID=3053513 RepID=UPI002576D4F3|nr:TetR family transcriptional regulator [Variovorax sp. J22P168]MDM0015390.1 TetR family transcriptional regulator [Variovorax sp. J22P168]
MSLKRSSKSPPALPRARPGRPRKAQSPGAAAEVLGRERILAAALALIDEKGLAAFNIRALATALGVYPAAVYWHVPSRGALVGGAIALALEGLARDLPEGPWQLRLGALMRGFRDVLRAHPHLAPAVASELATNASFDAPLLDHVIAALEDARFEGQALVDAFNVVIAAMCGFATLELSTAPVDMGAEWQEACRAQIDAVDPLRHPHLGRHVGALRDRAFQLRWTSGHDKPLESGFEAWIDVVLRGLESRSRMLRR